MIVQAYKCSRCGTLHEVDSDTYFKLEGVLTLGNNNILLDNSEHKPVIFCLNCLCSDINNFAKQYKKPVYRGE